jgi:hypothetical protein
VHFARRLVWLQPATPLLQVQEHLAQMERHRRLVQKI